MCMLHQNACDVVRFILYTVTTVSFNSTKLQILHALANMILKIKNMCQCAYDKIKTYSQNFFPSRANLRYGRAKFTGNFDLGRAFRKLSSLALFQHLGKKKNWMNIF